MYLMQTYEPEQPQLEMYILLNSKSPQSLVASMQVDTTKKTFIQRLHYKYSKNTGDSLQRLPCNHSKTVEKSI